MIATVRFIGLLNAAIWLGSAVFAILGADKAVTSQGMQELLGPKHFPYYSGVIVELVNARFWHLHIGCAAVALLHLSAESLYFGRVLRKPWLVVLCGLLLIGVVEVSGLQPKMHQLHLAAHAVNRPPAARQQAANIYRNWHAVSTIFEIFTLAALSAYLWRIANPNDPTRFLTPGKYRG